MVRKDTSKTKRQKWKCGAVVKIRLGDWSHSYGQMLHEPEYAFFHIRTTDDIAAEDVVRNQLIFRLWVMRYAHSTGRWLKIGDAPVAPALQQPVLRFNQDPLKPEQIRLTYDGCEGPLGTIKDCENLECAAVWDPEHVEDRIRDHFAGVPNKWLLSLRPKVSPVAGELHRNGSST